MRGTCCVQYWCVHIANTFESFDILRMHDRIWKQYATYRKSDHPRDGRSWTSDPLRGQEDPGPYRGTKLTLVPLAGRITRSRRNIRTPFAFRSRSHSARLCAAGARARATDMVTSKVDAKIVILIAETRLRETLMHFLLRNPANTLRECGVLSIF